MSVICLQSLFLSLRYDQTLNKRNDDYESCGISKAGPITSPEALVDIEIDTPVAKGHDLLVRVQAVSVNPVDTKIRKNVSAEQSGWKVLGWDAVGTVEAIGDKVTQFKIGDVVWYAGALNRQGSNSELQLVDERIVGHKPKTLEVTEAAALL